jgi:hypothetical protein
MPFEIPRDQQIHCRELDSGNNLTGHFLINDDRITVTLYDYKEFFHLKVDKPVFLQTVSNNFISLYFNLDGSTWTPSREGKIAIVVYHQEIFCPERSDRKCIEAYKRGNAPRAI